MTATGSDEMVTTDNEVGMELLKYGWFLKV